MRSPTATSRARLARDFDEEDGLGDEADAIAAALPEATALVMTCPCDEVRGPLVLLHARAAELGPAEEHDQAISEHAEALADPTPAVLSAWSRAELRLAARGVDPERLAQRVIARESRSEIPTHEHLTALGLLASIVSDPAPLIRDATALAHLRDTQEPDAATLAFLFGPAVRDPLDLSWLAPELHLRASSYGTPRPDDLGDEKVFGPRRDFTCACGAYEGFASYGCVCEECGVEVITACTRRWRFGHLSLAVPVLHPRAQRIAALLLGRSVRAIDASCQSEFRELDLEALDEHLASLATRGKIYDGDHRVADRALMLEAVRSLGARFPDVLIFDVLSVPPPHSSMPRSRASIEPCGTLPWRSSPMRSTSCSRSRGPCRQGPSAERRRRLRMNPLHRSPVPRLRL